MEFPDSVRAAIPKFTNHTIMITIGGESFAGNWDFLSSADTAIAAANTAASWKRCVFDYYSYDNYCRCHRRRRTVFQDFTFDFSELGFLFLLFFFFFFFVFVFFFFFVFVFCYYY
jgi:hypothetical protein